MSIYDTTTLYGLAIKAADDYTRFFRAIAVAIEASRNSDKPMQKESALLTLKQSCTEFSATLTHTICVCDENSDTKGHIRFTDDGE